MVSSLSGEESSYETRMSPEDAAMVGMDNDVVELKAEIKPLE
jgi:hypothetical protein